jgi:hypothetical protein
LGPLVQNIEHLILVLTLITIGSGRARCKNAKIFYFKNDPNDEKVRERNMDTIAKDIR